MGTENIARSKLLETIDTRLYLRFTADSYALQIACHVISRDTEVPMSDKRLTYEGQGEAYLCLFNWRCNVFANTKRPYPPCSTSFDGITKSWNDIKHVELQFLTHCVDYIGPVICPACLKVSTEKIDAIHGLQHPLTLTGLRAFFGTQRILLPPVEVWQYWHRTEQGAA